ncbi:MAG: hypothetical protein HC915_01720 [Anaerolineae bacterium]|nr:hypothetical protein [Anaerolineae bacterium]
MGTEQLKWIGARLALVAVGVGFAFAMVQATLALFPDLTGETNLLNIRPGGERYIFRTYDGDTFHHQPGAVRPPAENIVLEDHLRYYDDDGFREPAMRADHYPVIALGDSYTEGGEVPWVDVLAEELDTPVRNLGWRGYGPLEMAAVMEQYGQGDHEWVLIGFFEGNDLGNVYTSTQRLQAEGQLDTSRNRNWGGDAEPFRPATSADDFTYIRCSTLWPKKTMTWPTLAVICGG